MKNTLFLRFYMALLQGLLGGTTPVKLCIETILSRQHGRLLGTKFQRPLMFEKWIQKSHIFIFSFFETLFWADFPLNIAKGI